MPLHRSLCLAGALLAVGGGLLACDSDPAAPRDVADSVTLLALPDTVGVGDTLAPRARVRNAYGDSLDVAMVQYSTSDPRVLAVLPDGRLRALAAGSAMVYATAMGERDSALVVTRRLPRALTFTLARDSLGTGDSLSPTGIMVLDGLGAPMGFASNVEWSTSDTLVIRANARTGTALAVGQGAADLIATSGTVSGRRRVRAGYHQALADVPNVADLALGRAFACGRTTAGQVYCWGRGTNGALGNGLESQTSPPTAVGGGRDFAAIAAARVSACGLATGAVYCWGIDRALASRTTVNPLPSQLLLPDSAGPVAEIVPSAEDDRCVRTTVGTLWCWGDNSDGAIGPRIATDLTMFTPRRLAGAPPFVRAAVGEFHGCGITAAGALWCWGSVGEAYQPSGGSGSESPVLVPTPRPVRAVATTLQGTCTIDDTGAIDCWGRDYGTFGTGNGAGALRPRTRVPASGNFVRIETAGGGTCALTDAGALWCWGLYAITGAARPAFRFAPSLTFTDFALGDIAGTAAVCGLTSDGRVLCDRPYDP